MKNPLLSLLLVFAGLSAGAENRPNFVIIMVDDMGFSDPGCFGGDVETPNIDSLAMNGLRFTQFYNAARCCPTRASLMTGKYPHQVGLIRNGRSLSLNDITIAEALRGAGYNTAMAGKWHLTKTVTGGRKHQDWLDHQIDLPQPFGPVETYPINRGFDKAYGVIWGVVNYFDPFSLVEGTRKIKSIPKDYYITNAITDKSVEYINAFAESDKPFFLYVAHCAPHWPLHALPEDIAKYKGHYDGGWDQLRKDRFKRQIEIGLLDPANTPLPPVTGGNAWTDLSDKERAFQAAKMEVHAAMIDRVDQGVGKIVQALKKTGQFDNTVILFLSDNGASPEVPGGPGYDRTGRTRDGEKVQYRGFDRPGPQKTYTGIGRSWASAANTPFRYWKKESYEGGCHTPFFVHWPKGLTTKPGSITTELCHVMDILPTCLDLAGAPLPKTFNGKEQKFEGKSFAPGLRRHAREGHDQICFEHAGGRAVRMGNWKLVALPGKPWSLYDLSKDRTETKDLARQNPERVAAMAKAWDAWADRAGAPKGHGNTRKKRK